MNEQQIRTLLEQVQAGEQSIDEAVTSLRILPFEDLGFAMVDHHRALRQGFPEVILCTGKTAAQVTAIAERIGHHRMSLRWYPRDYLQHGIMKTPGPSWYRRNGVIAVGGRY